VEELQEDAITAYGGEGIEFKILLSKGTFVPSLSAWRCRKNSWGSGRMPLKLVIPRPKVSRCQSQAGITGISCGKHHLPWQEHFQEEKVCEH